jgi:hypothetical protein
MTRLALEVKPAQVDIAICVFDPGRKARQVKCLLWLFVKCASGKGEARVRTLGGVVGQLRALYGPKGSQDVPATCQVVSSIRASAALHASPCLQ